MLFKDDYLLVMVIKIIYFRAPVPEGTDTQHPIICNDVYNPGKKDLCTLHCVNDNGFGFDDIFHDHPFEKTGICAIRYSSQTSYRHKNGCRSYRPGSTTIICSGQ